MATAYLRRLDKTMRARVVKRLEELGDDPFAYSKALQGTEVRSSRVGDYRLLFEIHEGRLLVFVLTIGSRGPVYRDL